MAVQGKKMGLFSVQDRIIHSPSHPIWDRTSPLRCQRVSVTKVVHEVYFFPLVQRTRNFAALFCQYTYYSSKINKANVKVTLEQAVKAQRGSRGIALLLF
jgi:hypothetical protein